MTLNEIQEKASQDHSSTIQRTFEEADELLTGKLSELVEAVIDSGPEELKVLDIGCATGNTLKEVVGRFSSKISNVSGTGLDLNPIPEMKTDEINFVAGNAESLPFPDNSFDVGYSVATLQYLNDPLKAILEADRVIKPGGVFLWFQVFPIVPFLNPSFKKIRDESPEMKSNFSLQPKVIINHPNSETETSTSFLKRYDFPLGATKDLGIKSQASRLYQLSSYGLRPSFLKFIFDNALISDEKRDKAFLRMGLVETFFSRKGRKYSLPTKIPWEDCTDAENIPLAPLLNLPSASKPPE